MASQGTSRLKNARWNCFRRAHWFLVPLVALCLCEWVGRSRFHFTVWWYAEADRAAADHRLDYLFIGNSRTAAAIDISTFEGIMSGRLKRAVHAVNLGQGYSTGVEHYLGLRRLFRHAPQHLNGCTVFFEAPGGQLDQERWTDPWVHPGQPQLILSLLETGDLPGLWRSKDPVKTKLDLTIRYLTRPSLVLSHREKIRERLFIRGTRLATGVLQGLTQSNIENGGDANLSPRGGIRGDHQAVRRARDLAISRTNEHACDQQPVIQQWDDTVYAEIVRLVEQHQGRVIFYKMPLSSVFSKLYETDAAVANRETFKAQADRWHSAVLAPVYSPSDEDFPDLWHLGRPGSLAFTAALAETYLSFVENASLGRRNPHADSGRNPSSPVLTQTKNAGN